MLLHIFPTGSLVENDPIELHCKMSFDISQCKEKQDLDKLHVEHLRKLLSDRGQVQGGSKSELMTRLWPLIQTERIIDGPLVEVSRYIG